MDMEEKVVPERLRHLSSLDASRQQKVQPERPACAYTLIAVVRHSQAPVKKLDAVRVKK
jgi:hypothetical protein